MRITKRQIEVAYEVATQVFDGKLSREDGASSLQNEHDLNINSARDFIDDYRHMLDGKSFQRSMSAPAIDYFLTRIAADRGSSALGQAITAVRAHIKYFESIRTVNLHAMRTVVNRHEVHLTAPPLLTEQESKFNNAVKKALSDPPQKRQARLRDAAKMPVKIPVLTEVYQRNADVVAEVLDRANGTCERCHKPAPFMRKKDGTPYLEVHHKKQFANGGEDTVENAIALCANCHRELHYGVKRA